MVRRRLLVVLVVALALGFNAKPAGASSSPNHLVETALSQVPLTDDPSPPTAVPIDPPHETNGLRGDPGDGGAAFTIQPGDTLWHIHLLTGVSVAALEARNHVTDPRRLQIGQLIIVPSGPAAGGRTPEAVSGAAARSLLVAAAHEFGVNPALVEAIAMWESGLNQDEVSAAGAIGLMQVIPDTAAWAGPMLLGRTVDIYLAGDNARLGAALISHYLDEFPSPKLALAAYYQGETATLKHGIREISQHYVDGVWALRNQIMAGLTPG